MTTIAIERLTQVFEHLMSNPNEFDMAASALWEEAGCLAHHVLIMFDSERPYPYTWDEMVNRASSALDIPPEQGKVLFELSQWEKGDSDWYHKAPKFSVDRVKAARDAVFYRLGVRVK